MKKKTLKLLAVILTSLVLILTFSACSATGSSDRYVSEGMPSDSEVSGDLLDPGDASANNEGNVSDNRKIIEKVYLTVQTKEFDVLHGKIESEIKTLGGYIEKSSVSGSRDEGNRFADLTIRIPSEKSSNFTAFISDNSTVTNKEIETEDVTLSYIDTESRVSALETEKASLEKLLAEAKDLSDIISIQDKLTEVIYEIESYKSQLRTYDSLINYATITVRIYEVDRVVVVEEQTMWEEIGTNLRENFEDIGFGLKRFFIWFVSILPYMLLLGIIGLIPLVIVKICTRRSGKKNG